ncbi:3'-5' exonuclease [Streptomyces sp. WAC 05379]|uniref:3'-5' exonuclease n=1 Tax=Streptomyces sp. WAC 05379 TaxID=2203207 RepID=UPI000F74BD99|nr:3'-5' exonuclease [Streptomyces sp. WAC 05379]RSN90118.1 3'-5' exonuclease [Streptomyces sp. WAC 05379]
MTDTTTADARAARTSVPVYGRKEVPEHLHHLCTTTELKAQRLRPADGQQPVALLRVYRRGHGWGEFPLYDPARAARMRPLSAKQQAAMTARRTCPQCNEVRDHVVHQACGPCRTRRWQEQLDLDARTCVWCRRVSAAPHPQERSGQCTPCWLYRGLYRQFDEERRAIRARTCPGRDCETVTAADEEIAAARAAGTWRGPRWCPPCAELDELERAERRCADQEARERAEEARRRTVTGLMEWARTVLADPDTVVLDTETTGLHRQARIVELGVLGVSGDSLVDTLLNPGVPIPAEATDHHGITDDQVSDASSFEDALPRLTAALTGKRVLIYNAAFDIGRLRYELIRYHVERIAQEQARQASDTEVSAGLPERAEAEAAARTAAWIDGMRFEDVMGPYSAWAGEWSEYWGNHAWQPLPGGAHRALGDCQAVLEVLKEMATGHGTT